MNDTPQQSRHLPPRLAHYMTKLEDGPLEVDGRSERWIDDLTECQFVRAHFSRGKRKISITVELTERGRYALERQRRGVDPYLVMT